MFYHIEKVFFFFYFADGGPAAAVNYDAKTGFMCSGIGVSSNALFLALFLSPSNYTQQSRESHQIHVGYSADIISLGTSLFVKVITKTV